MSTTPATAKYDINADGLINGLDLNLTEKMFFKGSCGNSPATPAQPVTPAGATFDYLCSSGCTSGSTNGSPSNLVSKGGFFDIKVRLTAAPAGPFAAVVTSLVYDSSLVTLNSMEDKANGTIWPSGSGGGCAVTGFAQLASTWPGFGGTPPGVPGNPLLTGSWRAGLSFCTGILVGGGGGYPGSTNIGDLVVYHFQAGNTAGATGVHLAQNGDMTGGVNEFVGSYTTNTFDATVHVPQVPVSYTCTQNCQTNIVQGHEPRHGPLFVSLASAPMLSPMFSSPSLALTIVDKSVGGIAVPPSSIAAADDSHSWMGVWFYGLLSVGLFTATALLGWRIVLARRRSTG